MGGAVRLCGPIPTPAVAHLTVSMRADAGIVISASHNPYADNGIEVFGGDGLKREDKGLRVFGGECFKLVDEAEAEIERLMDEGALPRRTGREIGRAEKLEDA